MANKDLSGRHAARARRDAQIYGKAALSATAGKMAPASAPAPAPAQPVVSAKPAVSVAARSVPSTASVGRDASKARRQAMSARGKAGVRSADRQRTESHARAADKQVQKQGCGCGCNGRGDCAETKSTATAPLQTAAPAVLPPVRRKEVKVVQPSSAGRANARMRRQAMAAHGKNGADACRKGLSSAQLVRQQNPDISGRELARSVRAQRASSGSSGAVRSAPVGRRRPSRDDNDVTGTRVSHSVKTTGDETGLCRSITGTEYFSSDVFSEFCQAEAPSVPHKVEVTTTMRGGHVTSGGRVGRSDKVTGDERGSCRAITGSEYVGREQFDDFCKTKPEPGSAKVSFSQTSRGQIVSGSKPARSHKVTGDEPGTCKAVTGTPYAGVEQYKEYCEPSQSQVAQERAQHRSGNAGRDITGLQPGLSGLTGAERGACLNVSGTAYLGATAQGDVCGAMPAQIGESDFPQPLGGAPWGAFSVVAPSQAAQHMTQLGNVTGTRYEQGRISGTFSMGEGKVTGTEQARFGNSKAAPQAAAAPVAAAEAKAARITGEGIDTGLKITGDDWDRGERVTGTEGSSAVKRNPTRRGPMSAMPGVAPKRNEEIPPSGAAVTGGTGSTEKGAPVTVSGGARG